MGIRFAASKTNVVSASKTTVSDDLLHKLECKACSLNKAKNLSTPKMQPSGSNDPIIYIIGDRPSAYEDEDGKHFGDKAGRYLLKQIPSELRKKVRYNNVTRCHSDAKGPDRIQIECCRPSIIRDIEECKPDIVFGLGQVPLAWINRPTGISLWRGRRTPVMIGSHVCWYYPIEHPSDLNARGGGQDWRKTDDEIAFEFDIKRAVNEVLNETLPPAKIHSAEFARKDIVCLQGGEKDLEYLEEFLEYAADQEVTGFDYETQNLRPYKLPRFSLPSALLTAAVSCRDETVAWAIDHPEARWNDQQKERVKSAFLRFLKSKAIKAVHNLSFEMEWTCFFYGNEYARSVPWQDTQTQTYVLDERVGDTKPGALSLEFITLQHFGINIKNLTTGLDKNQMAKMPLNRILPYNGIDAKYHRLNYLIMRQRIIDDGVEDVYEEKLRQVATAVLAQLKGLPVDNKINQDLAFEYQQRIDVALSDVLVEPEAIEFKKQKGKTFNPGSSHDVAYTLEHIIKSRTGQPGPGYSTTKDVLKQVGVPICDKVIVYREATKLKSTYVDPYSSENTDSKGFIHPNFGTTFTETGRLNCLTGDSLVYVLDEREKVQIKDIKAGDWIWSYGDDLKPIPKQVSWSGATKKSNDLVKVVYLTQGSRKKKFVKVTRDHPFRLRDGSYKLAGDLKENDRLLSVERGVDASGYRRIWFTGRSGDLKEHRYVASMIGINTEKHLHHLDRIKTNNKPDNLMPINHSDHSSLHCKETQLWKYSLNPNAYRTYKSGEDNPCYKFLTREEALRILHEGKGRPTHFRDAYGWDYETVMGKLNKLGIKWKEIRSLYNDRGELLSDLLEEARKKPTVGEAASILGVNYYKAKRLLEVDNNHKVVGVVELKQQEWVYDITIPETHNFIVNGVCVHNSEDPNVQNVPTRNKEAKKVRGQIRKPVIVSFDYGQIDARIIACGSRDKAYCKSLWDGYDIHMGWARKLAPIMPKWVGGEKFIHDEAKLKDFRSGKVKNQWVFALFYGAALKTTAGRFEVEERILQKPYAEFWDEFKDVKIWQNNIIDLFSETGYVQLLGGQRRRAPLSRGQLINCVDLETECLTQYGWKHVDDMKKGDLIYTKNPETGAIELQKCFGITRAFYKGDVFVLKGGAVDAVTTPNHRWLCDIYRAHDKGKPNYSKVGFLQSDQFTMCGSTERIHLTGDGINTKGGLWTDDEVRLIGWLLTDGCYIKHERKWGNYKTIIITQSESANPEKVAYIDELFERLFATGQYKELPNCPDKRYWYTRYVVGKRFQIQWGVFNTLTEKIYNALPEKTITGEFLEQLSLSQLKLLYSTMLMGDGCWDKETQTYRTFVAGTKERADMFSMLCVLIGKPHHVLYRDMSNRIPKKYDSMDNIPQTKGNWLVKFKQRKYYHPRGIFEPFDGEVWCPQVSNQTFIARRNGRVYVTGNTPVQNGTNRIVMNGMNRLSETGNPLLQAPLQIHDDLTFWFNSDRDFEDSVETIIETMLDGSDFPWFCVPLTIEMKYGNSWADLQTIDKDHEVFSSVDFLDWPKRHSDFL